MDVFTDEDREMDVLRLSACVEGLAQPARRVAATMRFDDGVRIDEGPSSGHSNGEGALCQLSRSGLRLIRDKGGDVAGAIRVSIHGSGLRAILSGMAAHLNLEADDMTNGNVSLSTMVVEDHDSAAARLTSLRVTFDRHQTGEGHGRDGRPARRYTLEVPLE